MKNSYETTCLIKIIFSVFSHNVRSLSNKWDDFKQILNDFSTGNFKFSAICLQEIWSLNPVFKFALEGYSPCTRNLEHVILTVKLGRVTMRVLGGEGGGIAGGDETRLKEAGLVEGWVCSLTLGMNLRL